MELETVKSEWELETERIKQELKDNASLFTHYFKVKDSIREERPEGMKETPEERLARQQRNAKKEAYFQEMEAKFPYTLNRAKTFIFATDLFKGKPEHREFIRRLYLHSMKEQGRDGNINFFGRLLENRVHNWEQEDDKEVFARFAALKRDDIGQEHAGARRISKYCDSFVGLRAMNPGKSVCQLVQNAETMREANRMIENAMNPRKGNQPFTLYYKNDCREVLGRIYTLVHIGETNFQYAPPEIKKALKRVKKTEERDPPKDVLTREEIRKIMQYAPTLERAFLFLIFESGCRVSEIEFLHVSSLRHTKEGIEITIPKGKTGSRDVWIRESVPYVMNWLNEHPIRGADGKPDPNAYLFVSPRTKERLDQAAMRDRYKKVTSTIPEFKNRRLWLHQLRTSRASELGGMLGMTEPLMDKVFGWQVGGDTCRTYIHLTKKQVQDALESTFRGGKVEHDMRIQTERQCSNCKKMVPMTDKYCTCGQIMDIEKIPESIITKENMEEIVKKQNEMIEQQTKMIEKMQKQFAKLNFKPVLEKHR